MTAWRSETNEHWLILFKQKSEELSVKNKYIKNNEQLIQIWYSQNGFILAYFAYNYFWIIC